MKLTFNSLFAGFGLADRGLEAQGLEPGWHFELEPRLAEVGQANTGGRYVVGDVREANWSRYDAPDVLWASPPCTEFSQANTGGAESALEVECAEATARAVQVWRPSIFLMENVWGYRTARSFGLICHELRRLGYQFDYWHLNSANHSVPQTRKRLILAAVLGGERPRCPQATHAENPGETLCLFGEPLLPWRGWYGAVEDMLDELPESRFAEWQMERLRALPEWGQWLFNGHENEGREATFRAQQEPAFSVTAGMGRRPAQLPAALLVPGGSGGSEVWPVREDGQPSNVVTTTQMPRALLVYEQNAGREPTIRQAQEPSATLTVHSPKHPEPKSSLECGRVVQMTPPALARFQGLPDSYQLTGHRKTDCTGIGNGVPPALAAAALRAAIAAR